MNRNGPKVEIFSQGHEVVSGQTVDTNAAWLSQNLIRMGFNVTRHTAVGDRLDDLVSLLLEISRRADGCISSGGLGPTSDDLTAEAVSEAFGLPLKEDAEALREIEAYFARMERPMPAVNRKQALLPEGARRLNNRWGTAPGFILEANACWFAFLPGVPSEMRNLFATQVKPQLEERFRATPWKMVTLRTVGIGESGIQERLDAVSFPDGIEFSFRSGPHHIETKLLFPPDFPEELLRESVKKAAAAIGKPLFGIDGLDGEEGGSLPAVIGRLLAAKGETLALAETVTGGLVASQCLAETGFVESIVMRDPVRLLRRFGLTPSHRDDEDSNTDAAKGLARALRSQTGADYGLAQLWFGGPVRLRDEEARLRFYNALATDDKVYSETGMTAGNVVRKQNLAASALLDLLRRYLQGVL